MIDTRWLVLAFGLIVALGLGAAAAALPDAKLLAASKKVGNWRLRRGLTAAGWAALGWVVLCLAVNAVFLGREEFAEFTVIRLPEGQPVPPLVRETWGEIKPGMMVLFYADFTDRFEVFSVEALPKGTELPAAGGSATLRVKLLYDFGRMRGYGASALNGRPVGGAWRGGRTPMPSKLENRARSQPDAP